MAELYKMQLIDNAFLKGYYRFESGALATDSSGEGRTLLVEAGTPTEDASGKYGGAVALNGAACYKQLDGEFQPTTAFTVGLWFKKSAAGDAGFFQSWSQNSNLAGIRLWLSSGNFVLNSGRNTGTTEGTDWKQVSVDDPTDNDGAWHQLVGVWDGSFLYLYLDGALLGSAVAWSNAPGYNATTYRRWGCLNNAGTNIVFFTGSMDDFFFFNGKGLTATEVLNLYNGTEDVASTLQVNYRPRKRTPGAVSV